MRPESSSSSPSQDDRRRAHALSLLFSDSGERMDPEDMYDVLKVAREPDSGSESDLDLHSFRENKASAYSSYCEPCTSYNSKQLLIDENYQGAYPEAHELLAPNKFTVDMDAHRRFTVGLIDNPIPRDSTRFNPKNAIQHNLYRSYMSRMAPSESSLIENSVLRPCTYLFLSVAARNVQGWSVDLPKGHFGESPRYATSSYMIVPNHLIPTEWQPLVKLVVRGDYVPLEEWDVERAVSVIYPFVQSSLSVEQSDAR